MSKEKNNLHLQQEQIRIDLAAMFRLTAMHGWDDTIWNHITARVPGSDHHFYMHRFGLSYEEVCASNLIKVDEEGNVLEGPKDVNTAGFIIHSAIHLNHPNNKFVFHAHPPSAIAATAFKEIPFLVQDSSMLFGKIGYHEWEGLSVDPDERLRIAKNLGNNSCLVMRNHGFLTVVGRALDAQRAWRRSPSIRAWKSHGLGARYPVPATFPQLPRNSTWWGSSHGATWCVTYSAIEWHMAAIH